MRDKQKVRQTKADWMRLIAMILLPLTALAYLYYSLETYTLVVHNDAGFLISVYVAACLFALVVLWEKSRGRGMRFNVMAVAALMVLMFVFAVAQKIPFCVECDHVTAEELGFLTRWIPPYGS